MVVRLEAKQIRYAVTQCAKGQRPSEVAPETGVTTRHVQRMYARFRKAGCMHHVHLKPGRRSAPVPDGAVRAVPGEHGLVTPSPAKSRPRKYVRFERRYSDSLPRSNRLVAAQEVASGYAGSLV